MGVFDGASKATLPGNGQWFQEGRYVVEIVRCVHIKNGYNGESYVIESRVLWADSKDERAPEVGAKGTQVIKMNDMAQGNIMQFMCALYDVKSPAAKTDAQWAKLGAKVFMDSRDADTESAAAGSILELECFLKETKRSTKATHFTVHNWSSISDARLEELGIAA